MASELVLIPRAKYEHLLQKCADKSHTTKEDRYSQKLQPIVSQKAEQKGGKRVLEYNDKEPSQLYVKQKFNDFRKSELRGNKKKKVSFENPPLQRDKTKKTTVVKSLSLGDKKKTATEKSQLLRVKKRKTDIEKVPSTASRRLIKRDWIEYHI